jgi:hypothetical protein
MHHVSDRDMKKVKKGGRETETHVSFGTLSSMGWSVRQVVCWWMVFCAVVS